MAGISFSYCQLIKIILSQIGGNPIQQVYNELHQGRPGLIPGSAIVPNALAEVKSLIDTVTNTIHAAQVAANDFSSTLENIGGIFYQNPLGTSLAAAILAIDNRITVVDALLVSDPGNATLLAEKSALETNRAQLVTYKNNTDRLSGVTTQQTGSSLAGGCSLQDLLGSACTPNNDVPDVDLKALLDSLKNKDYIDAITQKIVNATGYAEYQTELAVFQTTISGLNASFIASINKASIRSAVTAQLTQIVYNLLTGCGGQVLDVTLQSNVKDKVAAWVTLLENQREQGDAYIDAYGNVATNQTVTTAPIISADIKVTLTDPGTGITR